MTTSPSEYTVLPTTDVPAAPNVLPIKRGRGRPLGVKNSVKRKPATKKVVINTEAIVANAEVKKLKAEVERLAVEVKRWTEAFDYLEGKIFKS
jgi:hypothetical protein